MNSLRSPSMSHASGPQWPSVALVAGTWRDQRMKQVWQGATPGNESFKKPRIYWYQTDLEVVMRIMLHDVEDYFLRVKIDQFEFSTNHEGVDYYLNLQLFGAVIADKTTHKTTGREITVRLSKVHKWADWPRLIYSSEKSTQIFVDIERLGANKPKQRLAPNWDVKNFSSYKLRNGITQIMPDVPSSNEEDSADEAYNLIFE